ncbi:MAG: PQQ-binding-like beta-propeller repeat protein, partial [Planctomycetia bacterium]|nr:PQQ-binding-like beta-propeller repeat protein [Planctomycetia bacterium]
MKIFFDYVIRVTAVASLLIATALCAGAQEAGSAKNPLFFRITPSGTGYLDEDIPDQPKKLWSWSAGDDSIEGTPVAADGLIFVGTTSGKIIALSLAEGKPIWTFDAKTMFPNAPLWY